MNSEILGTVDKKCDGAAVHYMNIHHCPENAGSDRNSTFRDLSNEKFVAPPREISTGGPRVRRSSALSAITVEGKLRDSQDFSPRILDAEISFLPEESSKYP